MPRFKKARQYVGKTLTLYINGGDRVIGEHEILGGERWARFCPEFLERLKDPVVKTQATTPETVVSEEVAEDLALHPDDSVLVLIALPEPAVFVQLPVEPVVETPELLPVPIEPEGQEPDQVVEPVLRSVSSDKKGRRRK